MFSIYVYIFLFPINFVTIALKLRKISDFNFGVLYLNSTLVWLPLLPTLYGYKYGY